MHNMYGKDLRLHAYFNQKGHGSYRFNEDRHKSESFIHDA